MIRAVLKNGEIRPIDPVPKDWVDGTELEITSTPPALNGSAEADPWEVLEKLAQDSDPEDEALLDAAIADIRRQARELAKRGKL